MSVSFIPVEVTTHFLLARRQSRYVFPIQRKATTLRHLLLAERKSIDYSGGFWWPSGVLSPSKCAFRVNPSCVSITCPIWNIRQRKPSLWFHRTKGTPWRLFHRHLPYESASDQAMLPAVHATNNLFYFCLLSHGSRQLARSERYLGDYLRALPPFGYGYRRGRASALLTHAHGSAPRTVDLWSACACLFVRSLAADHQLEADMHQSGNETNADPTVTSTLFVKVLRQLLTRK